MAGKLSPRGSRVNGFVLIHRQVTRRIGSALEVRACHRGQVARHFCQRMSEDRHVDSQGRHHREHYATAYELLSLRMFGLGRDTKQRGAFI
jgi:hypothetical protein